MSFRHQRSHNRLTVTTSITRPFHHLFTTTNTFLWFLLIPFLLLAITTTTTAAAATASSLEIKDQTFCSTGFAVYVNLDCYPKVVHVLKAEKGVLASDATACDASFGRDVAPLTSSICQNQASPTCTNAYGLRKGSFIRVVYQCIEHRSICGGSLTTPLVSDKSFHGGVTEMAPPLNSVGVIYSPRYKGENGQIPESADCSLIMKLPVEGKVTLSIKDFDLPRTHNCKTSSLSIYQTKDDVDVGGGKYSVLGHSLTP